MKWENVKLNDICIFENGDRGKNYPSRSKFVEHGIPFVNAGHLKNGKLNFEDMNYISKETYGLLSRGKFKRNDLLFCLRGSLGKYALIEKDITGAIASSLIIVKPTKVLNEKYLGYYFESNTCKIFIKNLKGGSTQPNLGASDLKKFQIPLPPLPTQKAIAELLDTADSLRRTTAEQLQQLDKLAESVFLEMFGDPGFNPKKWNVINLEKLILEGPTNGLYKPSKDYGSGTKIIRIDSFYYGLVSIKNLKRVELNDNDFKRYEIFEGDFVINRVNSGSHLGKCGLVPKLSERLVYESNMMRVKFDINKVNNQYLLKILSSQYIKNQISNCKKDAVNQSSINQKDVKNLVIPVPPIALQNEFAKIIANIEEQKVVLKESLADSEDMFNGLLQEIFS